MTTLSLVSIAKEHRLPLAANGLSIPVALDGSRLVAWKDGLALTGPSEQLVRQVHRAVSSELVYIHSGFGGTLAFPLRALPVVLGTLRKWSTEVRPPLVKAG